MNMAPSVLRSWPNTADSQQVGMTHDGKKVVEPAGQEAVGHEMGRRIQPAPASWSGGQQAWSDCIRTIACVLPTEWNEAKSRRPDGSGLHAFCSGAGIPLSESP